MDCTICVSRREVMSDPNAPKLPEKYSNGEHRGWAPGVSRLVSDLVGVLDDTSPDECLSGPGRRSTTAEGTAFPARIGADHRYRAVLHSARIDPSPAAANRFYWVNDLVPENQLDYRVGEVQPSTNSVLPRLRERRRHCSMCHPRATATSNHYSDTFRPKRAVPPPQSQSSRVQAIATISTLRERNSRSLQR